MELMGEAQSVAYYECSRSPSASPMVPALLARIVQRLEMSCVNREAREYQ